MILNQKKYFPILISSLFGIVAVGFSVGYFHLDEHYQILEFLSLKLGTGNTSNLPWEYQAQIRPWIQPFAYFLMSKIFGVIGVDSPYILEKIFRFFSLILFQISIWKLTDYFIQENKLTEKTASYLRWMTALFWVFPFLSVRISSEAVGGSLFFIGLVGALESLNQVKSFDLKSALRNLFFYSFILGVAVWVRFQLGAAVLGFLIWYIFISKRFKAKEFTLIAFGGILAAVVGIAIDFWGYGEFVVTPVKYFSRNILEGEAAKHGVTPWWEYFYISQKKLHPGFGLFVILCFFYQWIRNYKNVFSISMLLFLLMHIGTSHKELRFLFPMAMLIPVYLVLFCEQSGLIQKLPFKLRKFGSYILLSYFFIGSVLSSTRSPYQGVQAIKFLQDQDIEKAYYFSGIPFKNMSHVIEQSYYGANKTSEIGVENFNQIDESGSYYVTGRGGKQALLFQNQNCIEVFPKFNAFYFWMHYSRKFYKQDFYSIYKCN